MVALRRHGPLRPNDELVGLQEPNSIEGISVKVDSDTHHIDVVHLLEVKADFVADLKAIMDRLLLAEGSVTTSKLMVIVFDFPVEGMLLLIDCAFFDSLVAWCHELECEMFSETKLADWGECDAFELVPEVVTRSEVKLLLELLF